MTKLPNISLSYGLVNFCSNFCHLRRQLLVVFEIWSCQSSTSTMRGWIWIWFGLIRKGADEFNGDTVEVEISSECGSEHQDFWAKSCLGGRPRNIPSHTVPHSLCNSDFSGQKKNSRCLLMSYMMMECSSPLFSKGSQGGDISSGKVGVCVNQLHPTPPRCSNKISHWVHDLAHQQTMEDTW